MGFEGGVIGLKVTIRPDKCQSFAIKTFRTFVKQYKPTIYVNNVPVNKNESFRYLRSQKNIEHERELVETSENIHDTIHKLPLHPKNKLRLYNNYLVPKLCWNLTIADPDMTWIKQHLDTLCHNYFRRWLNISVGGTVQISQLSKSKFGMEIPHVSTKFTYC